MTRTLAIGHDGMHPSVPDVIVKLLVMITATGRGL